MRRRLLNVATALSLLLCVAVAALWVRSYLRTDTVCVVWGGEMVYCESSRGALEIAWSSRLLPSPLDLVAREAGERGWAWQVGPGQDRHTGMKRTSGFAWHYSIHDGRGVRILHVPHAAVLLAAACLPALYVTRRVRSRRRPGAAHCQHCGYDVRATPGRCPECGHATNAPPG